MNAQVRKIWFVGFDKNTWLFFMSTIVHTHMYHAIDSIDKTIVLSMLSEGKNLTFLR